MNGRTERNSIDLTTANAVMELEARIQCRLNGRLCYFRLVVADQGVILRGRSQTYYVKQLAQHAVMDATELPVLANEIEVS